MPDARRELQTIRPASHTTALGELFIAEELRFAQEEVYEVDSSAENGPLMGRQISQEAHARRVS
jgi:hypothetical protein